MVRRRQQALRIGNVVVKPSGISKGMAAMQPSASDGIAANTSNSNDNPQRLLTELRRVRVLLARSKAEVQELRRQMRNRAQQGGRSSKSQEAIQGIIHDLANMIETIGTAAVMMSGDTSQSSPLQQSMEAAIDQTDLLLEALRQASSSDSSLPLEAVDAGNIIEEVIQSAMLSVHTPGIRVQLQIEHLPHILCHGPSLCRCIHNLIWNAVQAMPSTGMLDISGRQEGEEVIIKISDTGQGIPRRLEKKVFSSRFSTKNGHRGLGLYVVRNLVMRMGGRVTVSSHLGYGTTFSLSFPVAKVEPIRHRSRNHHYAETK